MTTSRNFILTELTEHGLRLDLGGFQTLDEAVAACPVSVTQTGSEEWYGRASDGTVYLIHDQAAARSRLAEKDASQ